MTCDGRLFHRRAAATGNALSPTVDRRLRRTSRDVDEAERIVQLAMVRRQQWGVDSVQGYIEKMKSLHAVVRSNVDV